MTLFDVDETLRTADVDGQHRYRLTRRWARGTGMLGWIMLNPSTADGTEDDPTIRRCIGFARREGYRGIQVVNLSSYRSPDPASLLRAPILQGPRWERAVVDTLRSSLRVAAAWGTGGKARSLTPQLVAKVMPLVASSGVELVCLGTTKSGAPRHPLYVKAEQPFVLWPGGVS